MKLLKPSFYLALIMSINTLASTASAALITWNSVQSSTNSSDVVNTGALIEAVNASNTNNQDLLLNGVLFTSSNSLLSQGGFNGALNNNSTNDKAYDGFLNSFDFGNGTAPFLLSLGNGNLQNADDYLIQIWFTDLRGASNQRDMLFGDGNGNNVILNASAGGFGQFVTGTFTADGTSLELLLDAQGFGNAHITGYQIRQLPDNANTADVVNAPGTILLFGLSLCGLALSRKNIKSTIR